MIKTNESFTPLTIPRKTLTIKKEDIKGGDCGSYPQTVIIDIPLRFTNQDNYIINDSTNKIKFKFHNNSKAFINDNIYFGCGTFSAIYSIKLEDTTPDFKYLIPDKYKDKKGKSKNPTIATRLEELKKEIEKQINRINKEKNTELVERVYMYYDNCE